MPTLEHLVGLLGTRISTYSIAGAGFGYGTLWTALLSFPLMVSVQMMCSRLGMVTGRGLASVIRMHYPRWVLWGACLLLVTTNVINIAADLGGMGESAAMVTGVSAKVWTLLFTALIVSFLFWSSYRQIARVYKWKSCGNPRYERSCSTFRSKWQEGNGRAV